MQNPSNHLQASDAMPAGTTFLYAVAVLVLSVGCLQLLGLLGGSGGVPFAVATLTIYAPGQSWSRSIPSSWQWRTCGFLLALSLTILACALFPSAQMFATVRGVIGHVEFVVPLWLFLMWGIYRRWRKQRGVADA